MIHHCSLVLKPWVCSENPGLMWHQGTYRETPRKENKSQILQVMPHS